MGSESCDTGSSRQWCMGTLSYRPAPAYPSKSSPGRITHHPAISLGPRGEQWEKVGNWTQGEKRARVSGVSSAPLPLLAQEDPQNEVILHHTTEPSSTRQGGAHVWQGFDVQ
eukprot:1175645-Prorocentrum_minimum.AAC.1